MKGKRELEQDRAQLAGIAQDIEAGANGALVFGAGNTSRGRGGAAEFRDARPGQIRRGVPRRPRTRSLGPRQGRKCLMRKSLPQLGGEQESRIIRNALQPLMRLPWLQRRIERGVDLDGVEKLREVRRFVKALGTRRRINIAGPIGIGPAGRSNANLASRGAERVAGIALRRRVFGGTLPAPRDHSSFWVVVGHESRRTFRAASRVGMAI